MEQRRVSCHGSQCLEGGLAETEPRQYRETLQIGVDHVRIDVFLVQAERVQRRSIDALVSRQGVHARAPSDVRRHSNGQGDDRLLLQPVQRHLIRMNAMEDQDVRYAGQFVRVGKRVQRS